MRRIERAMSGDQILGGFSVINAGAAGWFRLITGTVTGKTALNCRAHFPVSVTLNSISGPWLHGPLVWCGE